MTEIEKTSSRITILRLLHLASMSLVCGAATGIVFADIIAPFIPSEFSWYTFSFWLKRSLLFPAFIGSLATGLILVSERKLGFVKQPWIVFKWAMSSIMLSLAGILLDPLAEFHGALVGMGFPVQTVQSLFHFLSKLTIPFEIVLCVCLGFLVYVGIRKPWRKEKLKGKRGRIVDAVVLEQDGQEGSQPNRSKPLIAREPHLSGRNAGR